MHSGTTEALLRSFAHDTLAYLRFALADMWHHSHPEILLPVVVVGAIMIGLVIQWKMENRSN